MRPAHAVIHSAPLDHRDRTAVCPIQEKKKKNQGHCIVGLKIKQFKVDVLFSNGEGNLLNLFPMQKTDVLIIGLIGNFFFLKTGMK